MRLFNIMATAFDNFDQSIQTFLSKTLGTIGVNYSHSQIFGVIFDGIKGIMQNIMFYIEDALTEQNIQTATRQKSVYSLAKLSGYDPYYGSAATGTLLCNVISNMTTTSGSTKIIIPNNTTLTNTTNGLNYTIELGTDNYIVDISKPLLQHQLKVIQGSFSTGTYAATGLQLETVHIDVSGYFDKTYIEVRVNGKLFEQVSNLYDMYEGSENYIVSTGYDNSFDIQFGNGTYGYSLKEGDVVTVKYLSHAGDIGNRLSTSNNNFIFNDMVYDSFGNRVNPNDFLTLTVSSSITGGTNADSAEFIRNMVGMNSRSLVLAADDNFKLFFKRFSFIGYVNCWSENNSMTIIATCLRKIDNTKTNYYDLTVDNLTLTDNEKQMVKDTLSNSKRAFAGVTLKFQDPIIRKFALICYVKPDNIYNKETILTSIKSSVANYFMNIKEDTQFIAKSDLMQTILDNSSNINAIDITIISETNEQAYYNGYYDTYIYKLINNNYEYVPLHKAYEENSCACLDNYGNISLDTKMEIPFLTSIRYYNKKSDYNKNSSVILPPVQVIYI